MLIDPRCDLKLFMEGYSCSVMSASINTAVTLTATVEVLPTKQVRDIKPMTNVVIGYRDVAGAKPVLADEAGVTYSVLFVGMVTGIAINKSGTSRSATLSCAGHQTLLQRHYTYVSNVATQSFSHQKNFSGASSFLRTDTGKGGLAAQVEAVFQDPAPPFTPGLAQLTGPPKGAVKLIEKCVGVTLPAGSAYEGKVHGAQHEFFAHASHQCRLLFQIDGVSVDDGLNSIIDKNTTGAALSGAASQLNDLTDLGTMLDILLKQLYYCFTPIGAPRTMIGTDTDVIQRGNTLTELRQKYVSEVISEGDVVPDTLGSPTAVDVSAAVEAVYKDIGEETDATVESKLRTVLEKTPQVVFPQLYDDIKASVPKDRVEALLNRCAPFLYTAVKLKKSGKKLTAQEADHISRATAAILRNIAAVAKVESSAQGNSFARVISYSLMPDLTFCTPPTCNVIFPNQIATFNYAKDAFNMPTRLLLHGSLVPNADEKKGGAAGYYAPSTSAFAHQGAVANEEEEIPLLPHEKFTGIVPSYASISFFEKYKTMDPSNSTEIMLRIANFNLMLQRYASTGITCTGPFNPFAAVGFPIAFIDVDDISAESPTTYVGILSSCSHSYSGAGNASTTYTVKSVREVGEVDEIFGDALLRATSGGPTATALTYTDTATEGGNFVQSALTRALSPLADMPAFLAAYDLRRDVELVVNGAKKQFRRAFLRPAVREILQKHVPPELKGRTVIGVEWEGTSIATPLVMLNGIGTEFKSTKALIEYIERQPLVNNVEYALERIAENLAEYFVATPEIIQTIVDIQGVLRSGAPQGAFSYTALNRVSGTKTALQLLNTKVKVQLQRGIHDEDASAALKGEHEITLLALLPLDVERIIASIVAGTTSFFNDAMSFPSNAFTSVSVFFDAGEQGTTPVASEKVAVEELYRPPWFSDIFSIANIGKAIYQHALGCGSVQDAVPASVPRDTTVNTANGGLLTHTTQTSLLEAYRAYKEAPAYSKGEFVNAFVRRPIANVQDVLGENGLLTTPIADACVVDLGQICNKSKVRDLAATDATSTSLTFDPNELVSEKRAGVNAYIASIKGDAFR